MDVLVMPSYYEGLPVVVVEAQASGLPLILSDHVPSPNIIGDVISLPLEEENEIWAGKIVDCMHIKRKENVKKLFQDAGYDIATEARKLQKFYLHGWKGQR